MPVSICVFRIEFLVGFRVSFPNIALEARRTFAIRISHFITLYIFCDYED